MRSNLKCGTLKAVGAAIGLVAALIQPIPVAFSQQPAMGDHAPPHDHQMPDLMQQHHQQMGSPVPTMPGQAAFGAIQEIVRLLEADPNTDWSTVDLEALRQHLIDMNEATLKANASANPVDGGLEIAVTGDGRTLAAIQRMVPAHAQELNRMNGWSAKTELLPNGVLLTVTASDPKEIQHIQGLGFIGLLVSGSHHQPHHLGMAKGEFQHHH
jgi:hypothetical protein